MNTSNGTPTARVVTAELHGARVDRAVAALFHVPTATARRLCRDERVRVGGRRAAAGDRVTQGVTVAVEGVSIAEAGAVRWLAPGGEVAVVYVDDELLVVDKPAGMAVHPLVPGRGGTVVDAVVAAWPEVEHAGPDPREGGLLHRLDTGTSGCLAFARSPGAFQRWAPLLRDGDGAVEKTYLALVRGAIEGAFVVDDPIEHDPADARRMRIGPAGRPASTSVTPVRRAGPDTVVALQLRGGRRHQLRVHLAVRGHPLVDDPLYDPRAAATRFWLHAWRLQLPDRPLIEAPPPARLAR